MKPSKELNSLIATKVMGLTLKKEDCNAYWVDSDGDEPNYSTDFSYDISAAFEVVEKLRSMGLTIDVSSYPESREWLQSPYKGAEGKDWVLKKGTHYYQCSISRYEPEAFGWISVCDPLGDSAAHAICLAALKIVEND